MNVKFSFHIYKPPNMIATIMQTSFLCFFSSYWAFIIPTVDFCHLCKSSIIMWRMFWHLKRKEANLASINYIWNPTNHHHEFFLSLLFDYFWCHLCQLTLSNLALIYTDSCAACCYCNETEYLMMLSLILCQSNLPFFVFLWK